jgi:hypothetical protein
MKMGKNKHTQVKQPEDDVGGISVSHVALNEAETLPPDVALSAALIEPKDFTKKPVTIKAMQYTLINAGEIAAWFQQCNFEGYHFENVDGLTIKTLEGDHLARDGDYVIRGVKGEFYPCKPDIFVMLYDDAAPALPLDLPPENVAPDNGPTHLPVARLLYETEWNACLAMAFAGQGRDYLIDWGDIPFVMAQFVAEHPTAPDEAVLIHVKLTRKVVVLPNEDPRRVQLAVKLFRSYLQGQREINQQDAEAARIAEQQLSYQQTPQPKIDPEGTFVEVEQGPFDQASDLGKAAAARADVVE